MVLHSRCEYLEAIRKRYRQAPKKVKTIILDEFCATCGYHRKYAIRLLRKKPRIPSSQTRPGPRPVYQGEQLIAAVKDLWFATDQMCSKRLKVAIPLWLPFYEQFAPLSAQTRTKLLSASAATLDQLLKPFRARFPKGRCSTKPGTLLKNQIPIRTAAWDVTQPGFFEADTVAHCGNSMAGDFAFSLTFTDIFSGWTENRAVWGRGSRGVLREIADIENRLAFPILGFDCDNGLPSKSRTHLGQTTAAGFRLRDTRTGSWRCPLHLGCPADHSDRGPLTRPDAA